MRQLSLGLGDSPVGELSAWPHPLTLLRKRNESGNTRREETKKKVKRMGNTPHGVFSLRGYHFLFSALFSFSVFSLHPLFQWSLGHGKETGAPHSTIVTQASQGRRGSYHISHFCFPSRSYRTGYLDLPESHDPCFHGLDSSYSTLCRQT